VSYCNTVTRVFACEKLDAENSRLVREFFDRYTRLFEEIFKH
jgi:hypothetical protein